MPSPLSVLRRLRPPADPGTLAAYARTRDPDLLADLVRRHGGLVWGVCRRALPHRPDAEDAYQATWLVLAGNPGAVRTPAALPGFLHTVAVRVSRRVRAKRPRLMSADHLPGREPPAADAVLAGERLAAVDEELARLPDALRRPLVLHLLDGRTQDEAAAALGLSLSTVKRRLEAGKELLRVRLRGRGVDAGAVLAAGLAGVGPPAVVAGGSGAAVSLSLEVVSAMWMLKAKAWTAGLVVVAGLAAAGGGVMRAGGQGAGPPDGGAGPAAKLADPPPPVVAIQPAVVLPVPAANTAAVRAALEQTVRELEKVIAAADEAAAAQAKVAEATRNLPGVSIAEKMNATSLVARYRENAAMSRVKLAEVRVELAKLGPPPPTPPPAGGVPPVPPRLLRERVTVARRFLDQDRAVRMQGAINREESSAFQMGLAAMARELHDARRAADPTPAGVLAAAREWYLETRDAELYYQARAERGLNRAPVALAASSGRVNAETALFLATAAAPPAARAGLAPFAPAPVGYAGKVTEASMWAAVKPADGLSPLMALRVSRGGRPVGLLVVVNIASPDVPPEHRGQASGVVLPNPDGTVPALQVGDDVRP